MIAHAPGCDCGAIALCMEHVQAVCESTELPEDPSACALLQYWGAAPITGWNQGSRYSPLRQPYLTQKESQAHWGSQVLSHPQDKQPNKGC